MNINKKSVGTEVNYCHQKLLPIGYLPSKLDVLCGCRGKRIDRKQWPGNQTYMQILKENLQRYTDAPKRVEKTAVIISILDGISKNGARFVKLDDKTGRYCELTADQVYEKTSHSIRSMIRNKSTDCAASPRNISSKQRSSCEKGPYPPQKHQPKQCSQSMTSATSFETSAAVATMTRRGVDIGSTEMRCKNKTGSIDVFSFSSPHKQREDSMQKTHHSDLYDGFVDSNSIYSTKRNSLPIDFESTAKKEKLLSDDTGLDYDHHAFVDDDSSSSLSNPSFSPLPISFVSSDDDEGQQLKYDDIESVFDLLMDPEL